MEKHYLQLLKNIPLFNNISEENLQSVVDQAVVVEIPGDTQIINKGDVGDFLMVIIEGEVIVYLDLNDKSNKKINLSTLSNGDYFGEMALITGEPRSAHIKSLTECKLLKIDKIVFDELIAKNPSITLSLSHILSQRLKKANIEWAETFSVMESKIKPSGSLKEYHFSQLLQFCEKNSVTGLLILEKDKDKATLTFEKGILQRIDFNNLSEDEALDTLLNWKDGSFQIEPKSLEFIQTDSAANDKTMVVVTDFIKNVMIKIIRVTGKKNLEDIIRTSREEVSQFFSAISNLEINLDKYVDVHFNKKEKLGEKEILATGVFLQTIIENSKPYAVGMSFLDFNTIANKNAVTLEKLSFFDYMKQSKEFISISS